ncbi:MAG: phosphatase domain-containing protein [Calditrichia bacterium]
MSAAEKILIWLLDKLEFVFDRSKFTLRRWLNHLKPIKLVPYRGHSTATRVFLKGRVLKDKKIPPASAESSIWQNLRSMFRRFNSVEIPHIEVSAILNQQRFTTTTDGEGYFSLAIESDSAISAPKGWWTMPLEISHNPYGEQPAPIRATAVILKPPADAEFGIISDIDDTIVKTEATNLLQMLRLVLLNNSRTRLPFKGVAAFYQALHLGCRGHAANPIFYVSSGPWNMYDLLVDFMQVQDIPPGPVFLQDFGLGKTKFIKSIHLQHKLSVIEHILTIHRRLNFILMGDSGEKDPEIYREVVHKYPGRIKAIYIRDVGLQKRDLEVDAIIEELGAQNVEMLRIPDTLKAAEHAAENGFISPSALNEIRQEKEKDESAPEDYELVMDKVFRNPT